MFTIKSTASAVFAATALVSAAAGSTGALAHSNEARQIEQAQDIEQGRRDGSITWREGHALRKDQREIAAVKAEFEEDGRLTRREKKILNNMQDSAESHIASEATDSWHRPWWLPRFGR
jgi:hypothetical protein